MPPEREDEVALVLRYAEATYRAQTELRRRIAAIMAAVAIVLGFFTGWATVEWLQTRAAVAAVDDEPLVDALGVRIPDPRPAIERGQLRVQAFLWGSVAVIGGLWTLMSLGLWLLIRPSPLPPELRQVERDSPDQPPM